MSANTIDFAMWENRWAGQKRSLASLKSQVEASTLPRKGSLLSLITRLEAFGQRQIDFFIDGFSHDLLPPKDNYPPTFALSVVIDQIGFDINVIEQCANQRLQNHAIVQNRSRADLQDDPARQNAEKILNTLHLADTFTYKAVQPAVQKLGLDANTTVLTYFQKSPNVRVVPYAPIVLVGIPYSCLDQPCDFLAIPHEVGHYIFWHAAMPKLKTFPSAWCENWYEEIFADIYGAKIAGPVIALDFQDLQTARSTGDFFDDDGEHPAPVIRPFIHIQYLFDAGGHERWADKLLARWRLILDEKYRLAPPDLQFAKTPEGAFADPPQVKRKFKKGNGHLFDLDQAISQAAQEANSLKPLDVVIKHITRDLLATIPASSWLPPYIPAEAGSQDDVEDLYTHFETYFANITPAQLPDYNAATMPFSYPLIQEGEALKDKVLQGKGEPLTEDENWLKVLYAAGWATKGPKCEGSSGIC